MKQAQKSIVRELITHKLMKKFNPAHLSVINESSLHKVAPGSETHFRIQIVSGLFNNLNSVARHRLIYDTLDEEIKAGVHALALDCRSEEQWKANPEFARKGMPCMGKGSFQKEQPSKI